MPQPGSPTPGAPTGGTPNPGTPAAVAPAPVSIDLGALTKLAFKNGREREAWLLAQADAVANPEVAKKLTEECRWADLLKQPSMGARWGIGLNIALGKEPVPKGSNQKGKRKPYEGDPQAFGTKVTVIEGTAARLGTEKVRVPGNLNEKLFLYTGDLGEKVLNGFVERARQGKLGQRVKASFDGVVGEYDYDAYAAAGKQGNANQAGMLFRLNYAAAGGPPGNPSFVDQGALMPGVYYVGTNTDPEKAKELLEKAEKEGIDFYLQFDVTVNPAKEARSLTTVKVSLIHIPRAPDTKPADSKKAPKAKVERLYVSKTLENKKVEEVREAGKQDPVDTEVRAMFEEIEKRFELKDPPDSITAERVVTRCENLAEVGSDAVNPLRPMMEIRFWHAKGMIDDAKLEELYAKFVGTDEAKQLLTSDDANKRLEVITRFLPIPSSQDIASYAKLLSGGGAPVGNGPPAMASNGPPGAPGAPGGYPNPAAGSGPPTGSGPPGGYPNPSGGSAPPMGIGPGGYPNPSGSSSPPPGYGTGPTGFGGGSPPPGSSPTGGPPTGTGGGSPPPGSSPTGGPPTGTGGGSPAPGSSPTPGSGPPS